MSSGRKPNAKARAMLKKLAALAERGVDGEREVAQRKLARLKAQFNFESPAPDETPDLFAGVFKPSQKARKICSFPPSEMDVASSVKWAIEKATGIRCLHASGDLLAEAAAPSARKLAGVAEHIAHCFRTLTREFGAAAGVGRAERGVFIMGLYDGMMNDPRDPGQPLPRPAARKRTKKKDSGVRGLHLHPYTVAFSLGKQIRFSAPLETIQAELERVVKGCLGDTAA